jgi:hypothetical protein
MEPPEPDEAEFRAWQEQQNERRETVEVKVGEHAYTVWGQKVNVVADCPVGSKGFWVEPIFDGEDLIDDEMPYSGSPFFVKRLLPRPLIEERVEALTARSKELQEECGKIRGQIIHAKHEHDQLMKKLKKYECLKEIERYIDGDVTHYVLVNCYHAADIRILPRSEAKAEGSRSEERLLTLYGRRDWHGRQKPVHFDWYLSAYCVDGTDRDRRCFPCLSLEEAKSKAQVLLDQQFAEGDDSELKRLVAVAQEYDLSIPADAGVRLRELEEKELRDQRRKLTKEIEERQHQLDTLIGDHVTLTMS